MFNFIAVSTINAKWYIDGESFVRRFISVDGGCQTETAHILTTIQFWLCCPGKPTRMHICRHNPRKPAHHNRY